MRRWTLVSALALVLVLMSCSTPTRPPDAEVALELSVSSRSGQPGEPVIVAASVSNRGQSTVYHIEGCTERSGVSFEILDPEGRHVEVVEQAIRPECADNLAELRPNGEKRYSLRFDGTLYANDSAYPAPSGRYILFARFSYQRKNDASDAIVVARRATFRWNAP